MKTISLFLIALSVSFLLIGQNNNKEITLENGQKLLVGQISKEALSQQTYKAWYIPNYNSYTINTTVVNEFKDQLKDYQILVFLGTWCGDSKREVPRFMKILDTANFSSKNIKIIALDSRKDRYKKSPNGEEWGLQILRVPTFIFYKNGREQHRIIETPNKSLEEDISAILTGSTYIPNKAKSMHFD